MSETLHNLCSSIVNTFFGEFHAQLFSQLAYHGRLSAVKLAQQSHLPIKQVKAGLAVLIQAQVIYHHTNPDGSSNYQANVRSSYNLLRAGRLVELVRHEINDLASRVVAESILLGFSTVGELANRTLDTISQNEAPPLGDGIDDDVSQPLYSLMDIHQVIDTLIEAGFLSRVRSSHFQSYADVFVDTERDLKSRGVLPSTKGKKGMDEAELYVRQKVQEKRSLTVSEYGFVPDVSPNKKRTLDDKDDRPYSKRAKVNGGNHMQINGIAATASQQGRTENGLLVSVSFENLTRKIRNDYLSSKAIKVFGRTHGIVLGAALSFVPTSVQCGEDKAKVSLDIQTLRQRTRRNEYRPTQNGHTRNGAHTINGVHNHEADSDDESLTYNETDRALAILAESEFKFLRGENGQEWAVTREGLDHYVRRHEVLRIMGDRLGKPALRVIRMLNEKGKLDDKALQELGLLGAKDLRQILAELKQMGYVDLQEVPRESQRQPNRTMFLWFHDSDRVRKILLDELYAAIAKVLQRLECERKRLSTTLEKVERSDVQGNEEQIMSLAELRVLRRWQRQERWLMAETSRLDESVVLLRDL